jgi:hypothetical protein
VSRHDGQDLGANRRIGARARTAIADDPVDRRADFGVAEIEAREISISVRLIEVSRSLLTLCIDDVELALGSFKGRLRLAFAGTRFLVVGVGLFESLPGSEPIVAQRSVAVDVIFGAHPFSIAAARSARAWSSNDTRMRRVASTLAVAARRAAMFASVRASCAR